MLSPTMCGIGEAHSQLQKPVWFNLQLELHFKAINNFWSLNVHTHVHTTKKIFRKVKPSSGDQYCCLWDIAFKLVVKEQKNQGEPFVPLPFPAEEIQVEKSIPGKKSQHIHLSLTCGKYGIRYEGAQPGPGNQITHVPLKQKFACRIYSAFPQLPVILPISLLNSKTLNSKTFLSFIQNHIYPVVPHCLWNCHAHVNSSCTCIKIWYSLVNRSPLVY